MKKDFIQSKIEQFVINKVKEIRTFKVLSQAKFAHLIVLSVGFVGNIDNPTHIAKLNINHLNRISKELNIPFKDFFPEKGI